MPRTWSTSIVTHFDKRAFSTSQHKVPILTDISFSQEFFPGTTCTSSSAAPLSSLNRNGTVSFHSRRIHFQSKDSMSQAILTTRSSTRERVGECQGAIHSPWKGYFLSRNSISLFIRAGGGHGQKLFVAPLICVRVCVCVWGRSRERDARISFLWALGPTLHFIPEELFGGQRLLSATLQQFKETVSLLWFPHCTTN